MISLKTFHLIFIACSVILTGWFAFYQINLVDNGLSKTMAALSLLISVGLIIYGIKVIKKFKLLS